MKTTLRTLLCFLFPFFLGAAPALAAEPITPLRVSPNGRFFTDAAGRPVFVLADTAWGLFTRLKREEITEYLEHRRAQGFNAVAAVLFAPRNSDINQNATNAYGRDPFALAADGQFDPTRPLVTPGSDPAKAGEYDFWDHADFALAEMKRLGFYGFILPCWGNEVAPTINPDAPNPSAAARGTLVAPAVARAYGRWLGQRYATATHVQWMIGGDRAAVDTKTGADFRPAFRAMAAGLRDAAPRALLSYHSQKPSPQSGDWFHDDAWLAFNSVQLWPEDQVRTITRDWNARPVKPTWIFEGRYEGYRKRGYKPEDWGEWQVRQQAWQTVFAGSFGHTYGHESVFGFGAIGADWRAVLDKPGAASMTHLAAFMRALPPAVALTREPDPALLVGDAGRAERLKSDLVVCSRTPDGTFALAYAANGRAFTLALSRLAARAFDAGWFDPRSGRWHADGRESAEFRPALTGLVGGSRAAPREFDPPGDAGDGRDWILLLRAR